MTKQFILHPEVIDHRDFDAKWFGDRCADLLEANWGTPGVFGFDVQYDRTVDENGDPGEYVQVWMEVDDD